MFEMTVEPRFSETDGLRHISNTVFPVWFEAAREPIFKIFNPLMSLEEWPLILAKIDIDFVAQTYVGHPVKLKTFVSRLGSSSFDVFQQAYQRGELVARGTAVMVQFDYKTNKAEPIGKDIRNILESHFLPED